MKAVEATQAPKLGRSEVDRFDLNRFAIFLKILISAGRGYTGLQLAERELPAKQQTGG